MAKVPQLGLTSVNLWMIIFVALWLTSIHPVQFPVRTSNRISTKITMVVP